MDRYVNTYSIQGCSRIIRLLFWNLGLHMIMLGLAIFILLMFDKIYCQLFAGANVIYGFVYLLTFWITAYRNAGNNGSLTEHLQVTSTELEKLGLLKFLKLHCVDKCFRKQQTHPAMVLISPSGATVDSPVVQKRCSISPPSGRITGSYSRQAGSSTDDYDVLTECILGDSRIPPPRPSTSKPFSHQPLPRGRTQKESKSPRSLQRTRSWEEESCRIVSPSQVQDPLTRASRRLSFKSQSTEETASSSAVYLNVPISARRPSTDSESRSPTQESGVDRRTTRSSAKSDSKRR